MNKKIGEIMDEIKKSVGPIAFAILGIILVTILLAVIPTTMIIGLYLIGFPVVLSLKSVSGALLVLLSIRASMNKVEGK
jgi:hypothetical protein